MAQLLLHLADFKEAAWRDRFAAALPGHRVLLRGEDYDPAAVDYIFVWKPRPDAFAGLSNLKAILSLGAGVDALLRHPHLPDRPLVRFSDAALTRQMTDYVVAAVMMHTRLMTRFKADQAAKRWSQLYPPPSSSVTVGVMGAGVIGLDAISHFRQLGFTVKAWSRSPKQIDGVATFAGPAEFDSFLNGVDALVNLLPLTPETEGILNYETFSKLNRAGLTDGPVIVNGARGLHQREADIVRALGDGTLRAASLDVFEVEPLPAHSPLWELPNCYITPHIAGASTEATGAAYFSKVIRDHEAGAPLPNVVDRTRGY